MIVIDASVTLAWLYADERNPTVEVIFQEITRSGAIAPAFWRLEVANSLVQAVRRKRIDAKAQRGLLSILERLNVILDEKSAQHAWSTIIQLATLHSLTVYDATYLELAQRRRLPLATFDGALARAATASGVGVLTS